VQHDPTLAVAGVRGWRAELAELPDDPAETVMLQLERLGVEPQDHYVYLGRILTKLAGWAGMMNWWASNPAFAPQQGRPTDLLQYLAVRLTVELAVGRRRPPRRHRRRTAAPGCVRVLRPQRASSRPLASYLGA
jgi:uncharacterized protein YbcC (UPF0753/DUF2309 family)